MVMVGVGSGEADVRLVWAADTVMAAGLMIWLDNVAMDPRVVMGVASEAFALTKLPPARLLDTVPVTVPSVVTPEGTQAQVHHRS